MTTDLPVDAAKNDDESMLFDWLRERDVECPLCQYNLRGLTAPRCPECGHGLRLHVSIVDSYVKAWVTLAVAICGSAGMGLMFLCIVLREGMPHEGIVDVALLFFVATTPLPLVLLGTRRRFQRLSRSTQWWLTAAISALPLTAMVLLCANLR